jgi:hypothetical protein
MNCLGFHPPGNDTAAAGSPLVGGNPSSAVINQQWATVLR